MARAKCSSCKSENDVYWYQYEYEIRGRMLCYTCAKKLVQRPDKCLVHQADDTWLHIDYIRKH
jgi:hypothetical protein